LEGCSKKKEKEKLWGAIGENGGTKGGEGLGLSDGLEEVLMGKT